MQNIKKDFPIFTTNKDLVYLDSTATTLKPNVVISKLQEYYEQYSANVYRGVYKISEKATAEFEETRSIVAAFINAPKTEEVIFTSGATESLNLVMYSLGRQLLNKGNELVTTIMEHHSNFVPWQQLCFNIGADFKVVDIDNNGQLAFIKNGKVDRDELEDVVTERTKIFAITLVSNVLGTLNPLKEIIQAIKKINPETLVVVDAAQAVPHMKVDVQDLGADFVAFSAHKMLGPTGVGVLWGKTEHLERMDPFKYGGEMIEEVRIDNTTYKKIPHMFEAGTPNIADVIAFKESIKYIQNIGLDVIRNHEIELTRYAMNELKNTFQESISIIGPQNPEQRGGIVAFTFNNYHPHDVAQILDESNIAVRAGNHCAMPLHTRMDINATTRASFYIYNSTSDIDQLIEGLKKVKELLK